MTDIGATLFRLNVVLSLSILGGIGILAPLLHLEQFRNPFATLVASGISVPILFFSAFMPLINWFNWSDYRQMQLDLRSVDSTITPQVDATEFSYFITGAMQCGSSVAFLIVTWFWFWTDVFMKGYDSAERPPSPILYSPFDEMAALGISLFYGFLMLLWQLAAMGMPAFLKSFARHPDLLARGAIGTKNQAATLYITVTIGSMLAILFVASLSGFGLLGF